MKNLEGFTKGVNLGGWLSQCGSNYNEKHYSTFITEKDVKRISEWGLDHLRLPVDYNVVQTDDGKFIEEGFKHIDDCIKWCRKYDLKMVLDLHKANGYVFDNPEYCMFFESEDLQSLFLNLWLEFTRRYGKEEIVVFELLNEVTEARFANPWNEISTKVIKAIHDIEPEKVVMIGGIYNSSIYGLTLLPKPVDKRVVYTFHCYDPMIFTHQGAGWISGFTPEYRLKYRLDLKTMKNESNKVFGSDFDAHFENQADGLITSDFFRHDFISVKDVAEKWNVEMYCGEYGVIDEADRESAVEWYKDIHEVLVEMNIPRAAWSYKEMNFDLGNPINSMLIQYL